MIQTAHNNQAFVASHSCAVYCYWQQIIFADKMHAQSSGFEMKEPAIIS